MVMENFGVVDVHTRYKMILSKPWIDKMKVASSTYHKVIKYPIKEGIMEIWGD